MDYETMDWELEAQRVARAFGVKGECEFEEYNHGERPLTPDGLSPVCGRVLCQNDEPSIQLPAQNGQLFTCRYTKNLSCGYSIQLPDDDDKMTEIYLSEQGEIFSILQDDTAQTLFLAKGLFHLGLLTPQVEAALKVSITTHQKMEWTLEYEERHEL